MSLNAGKTEHRTKLRSLSIKSCPLSVLQKCWLNCHFCISNYVGVECVFFPLWKGNTAIGEREYHCDTTNSNWMRLSGDNDSIRVLCRPDVDLSCPSSVVVYSLMQVSIQVSTRECRYVTGIRERERMPSKNAGEIDLFLCVCVCSRFVRASFNL